jgi:hypothetical protein
MFAVKKNTCKGQWQKSMNTVYPLSRTFFIILIGEWKGLGSSPI